MVMHMLEIFGTLGPACQSPRLLEQMFLEGMTGMRLNMSHSGLKNSEKILNNYHQAACRAGVKPELLIDMQGPEIRIGLLPKPLDLKKADAVCLNPLEPPAQGAFPCPKPLEPLGQGLPSIPIPGHVFSALEPGRHILLDDGKLELAITAREPSVTARVIRGGILQSRKSLKVVGQYLAGPALTPQDKENILLAKDYGVTALMQPFVTCGEELLEVRKELRKSHMGHIRIFAKIENREGIRQIRNIIPHADVIVIARGDLGNDMPLWQLPAAQKELAEICRLEKKPFLVVTQMLASMEESPMPTRAEVSDIFHAVLDGADAVMATNETAVGKYPVETIRYLKKTAEEGLKWREGRRGDDFSAPA